MKTKFTTLAVLPTLAVLLGVPSTTQAAFILDPNTGTYIAGGADGSGNAGNTRPPITSEEKAAEAAKMADLREALSRYDRYFRYYRYVNVGAGAKSSSVDQGGTSGSETGYVFTVGFDYDGLTWPTPWIIELRGNAGFSPTAGETAIMWYMGAPIWKGWFDKSKNVPNPLIKDLADGMEWGKAVLKNGDKIPAWADQYYPIKIEIGAGLQGVSFEQDGGSITSGTNKFQGKTTGMIAGLSFAGRIGYFGENDMIRLTAYYLANSNAETGAEVSDPFFGGTMNIDTTVKGKMLEGKLDWYHRSDERIGKGSWVSGYGLSLIGRKIHLDQGQFTNAVFQGGTIQNVTTVFPEQDVTQIELLVTIGFLR